MKQNSCSVKTVNRGSNKLIIWLQKLTKYLNTYCMFPQINNPDMRVQILKDFVKQHFPSTQLLDYALDVEKITTSKVRSIASATIFPQHC